MQTKKTNRAITAAFVRSRLAVAATNLVAIVRNPSVLAVVAVAGFSAAPASAANWSQWTSWSGQYNGGQSTQGNGATINGNMVKDPRTGRWRALTQSEKNTRDARAGLPGGNNSGR